MQLVMDGKFYELDDRELCRMYIGEGLEGEVYRLKTETFDRALKIHKRGYCGKDRLSLEAALKMISIPTEKILLPRGIIYDVHGNYIGYYEEFINSKYNPVPSVRRLNARSFADKLDSIYNELDWLTACNISLQDLILVNFCYNCYNGNFHFVDPGSYRFVDSNYSKLLAKNEEAFFEFVIWDILCNNTQINNKSKLFVNNHFLGCGHISDVIRDESLQGETVSAYVRRLIK